ncbi:heavy metal translocating P-type ATPase [Cyclobacterium jeungdonense]|uniref:Heavy metal translocating P-type ATPase metal-binding domain-containing protein n=1 Tax=Cyclobacterium jeungdonense TaxID=708087 RepID=A0ABT8C775_9BACT|nr:heavy metal translocating P-type ATPase metal-binding domain-containing protein [Cyclobacterium jeungdonense]MDN3688659.1 heavy metal translocating P-type ATPase metal-binding domain-containing protein [Cyclobacterium jeungdonense]
MKNTSTRIHDETRTTCFHCGELCERDIILHDHKDFCCTGCKTVYEVLNENDLCDYYKISDSPGGNQKNENERLNRFDYLDDQEVLDNLVDFKDDNNIHITFYVPLIHCASCIWLLENLHRLHEGIYYSRVNFINKKVQVKFLKEKISLKELVSLMAGIGYEPQIHLSDMVHPKKTVVDRKLVYKLAVAGFCFGNMMFFSLPEYFSEAELLGDGFRELFRYLNVVLALPVFFYSATDYFRNAWMSLKNKSVSMEVPIALGIATLFSYSLYEIFVIGQEGYLDTMGGLLFFLLVGKWYQQKTFDSLSFDRDYTSYFPIAVSRMVKDREEVIPLTKIQVGDRISVRNEELVPADSVLLDGEALIDYSFVTGEEVPVRVKKGALVYAGGRLKGSSVQLLVQKSPSQGYLTDLWNQETFNKEEQEDSLASLSARISGKFTLTVLLIAFGALFYWSFYDLPMGVRAFTAVLIITCPCALAMSTPFTLGNVMRIYGKRGFFLKNSQVIEKLAMVDTLVFDKTGTLTSPSKAQIIFEGETLSDETLSVLKAMVNHSIHPLSNRINRWLGNIPAASLAQVEEVPGKGLKAIYKSQDVSLGAAAFSALKNDFAIKRQGNKVHLLIEGVHLGTFFIESGMREGMEEMVQQLAKSHSLHLLSGDQDHERLYLEEKFGPGMHMYFQQSPKDKLNQIYRLREKGNQVLMVGDGLNDSGALKAGQVGIAVTENISHFSPASDAILDGEKLRHLPGYLEYARLGRKIIKSSFGLSFTYNALGIFFAVQGLVSPVFCAILMPASSISVVLFTTLATNYFAHKKGMNEDPTLEWK